jgi:hypothetical protein
MKYRKKSNSKPTPAPTLNQDVMNKISSYLSYKEGLGFFRQTSKHMNELIEQTPAGQLARQANDMEPAAIRLLLSPADEWSTPAAFCGFVGGTGIAIGTGAAMLSALSYFTPTGFGVAIYMMVGGLSTGTVALGVAVVSGSRIITGLQNFLYDNEQNVRNAHSVISNIRNELNELCSESLTDAASAPPTVIQCGF